ncbi:MAG: hypothetical protein IIB61_04415, partial [Planctomycetes bacterium]|nr:hypothetical protein [Planctomycetota bacterium]
MGEATMHEQDDPLIVSPTSRGGGPPKPEIGRGGAIEESFEWSERVKARAMLDTLNRYDRRMARAIATGDVEAMSRVRDLCGKVVSIEELQSAPGWTADKARLEYTYGVR